jgi:hypothetical protein
VPRLEGVATKAALVAMKATKVSLSDLLFPAYSRRKALMLLLHPERSLHVREIARLACAPAGTMVKVLIVGDVDFASVLNAPYDAQAKLQREINPKVLSLQEWTERAQSGPYFVRHLLGKPKIFLIEGEDDLEVPAKPSRGRNA